MYGVMWVKDDNAGFADVSSREEAIVLNNALMAAGFRVEWWQIPDLRTNARNYVTRFGGPAT
jgi:hypothetical protein